MGEHEWIAVLVTLPRPGRIEVATTTGDHWRSVGIPVWNDGWPDTAQALEQLREAGFVPAGTGCSGWRSDHRGWAIELTVRE